MIRLVYRKDLDDRLEAGPTPCSTTRNRVESESALTPLEQCVLSVLKDGEETVGHSDRRPILRGAELVGFIDIVDG